MGQLSSLGKRIRGHKGVALRKKRMALSGWLCVDCLAQKPPRLTTATVVDHIVPLSLGGEDVTSNTRNLCDRHHEIRTAEQFGHRVKAIIGPDGWAVEENRPEAC